MAEVKNICLEALERHCAARRHRRLDFHRGIYDGEIFTDDGLIVHAQLSALEGVPALFRLFDWGDAETTWQPGITPEKPTLHLTMEAASTLYAENLQERAELEARDKTRIDQALLAPESVPNSTMGLESVLKHYTISLECFRPGGAPGGFTFVDANKSSYVIGSSEECDVGLNDQSVDPLHCGVILERGSVLVWDLGAQSGVKLNGNPIAQDILKVGDVMILGDAELRVRFQFGVPRSSPSPPRRSTRKPSRPAAPSPWERPLRRRRRPPHRHRACPKHRCRNSKEVPKGAITYDKVVKQLKQRDKGVTFPRQARFVVWLKERNRLDFNRLPPNLSRMHILLIDDSSSTRSLLRTLINSGQAVRHEISEAASGEEALQKVGSGEINLPDVVIMDINMGGMSGYEVCREFRQRHGTASDVVPYIIIVTANEGVDVINQALECGANDYMPKPVNVKILQVRLRVAEKLLAHAKPAAAP